MTDKPIIQASLVDVRNVATDKEIKLEVRVPAELAQQVFSIFGWPTRVAPVSVAICPLGPDPTRQGLEQPPRPSADDAFKRLDPPKDRQSFTKMKRAQQAGIRCNEPTFWAYLTERFSKALDYAAVVDADGAAHVVRWHCLVTSRRELDEKPGAQVLWDNLEADFYAKQHGMH